MLVVLRIAGLSTVNLLLLVIVTMILKIRRGRDSSKRAFGSSSIWVIYVSGAAEIMARSSASCLSSWTVLWSWVLLVVLVVAIVDLSSVIEFRRFLELMLSYVVCFLDVQDSVPDVCRSAEDVVAIHSGLLD